MTRNLILAAALMASCAPAALARAGDNAATPREVYQPDFFECFAPRTALDMVGEVPGFQIRSEGAASAGWARRTIMC